MLKPKSPIESEITMREMVMPNMTNPHGTIFGGQVMSWIDIAAAMCSMKHCARQVVTVHVGEIDFINPIKLGHHVSIKAKMNYVGKTSMVVGVKVESENPFTGEVRTTTRAYLTFVCLDDLGKPSPVPPLKIETPEDQRRYDNAKERVANRKTLLNKLKAADR